MGSPAWIQVGLLLKQALCSQSELVGGGITVGKASVLVRKDPETLGISSRAILGFIDAVHESKLELHSLMVLRHGAVAAEGWWAPYSPELRHSLYSLSKSFTSTGIGLAVQEGRISLDDQVISFFPADLPLEVSESLAAMRVRHLLTMSTGHSQDDVDAFRFAKPGITRRFLQMPVRHEPGTHFVYNTPASYILSAIVTKVTGLTLADYLKPRLFDPLEIDAEWELSSEGINMGGFGLSIRTEDIAKFGQLYLDKGVWRGQRILTEEWVGEATSKQVSNGDGGDSDWSQGYGYQFWRCKHGVFRGDGMFGQYCIVMPSQDAVVAITANVTDMQAVLTLVWRHLLPAMGDAPLPQDHESRELLAQKLSSLAIQPPVTRTSSPMVGDVSGKRFSVKGTDGSPSWEVVVTFGQDRCAVGFGHAKGHYDLQCGLGYWLTSETRLPGRRVPELGSARVAASAGWSDDSTLVITVRFIETPVVQTIALRFDGDFLTVESRES